LKNSIYLFVTIFILSIVGCATTSDIKEVQSDHHKFVEKITAVETELSTLKKTVAALDTARKAHANTAADLADLRDSLNKLRGDLEVLKNELADNTRRQEQYFDNILLKINFIENFLEIGGKDVSIKKSANSDLTAGEEVQKPEKVQDKDRAYSSAYQIFKEGNYSKARQEFQNFLSAYPDSEYSDNAQFWIGECFFLEKNYEQAILEYEKVVKNYPSGARVSYALLKQGLSFLNLGDKTSSRLLLQQVIKDYPNTNQARIARAKLQEIK